MAGSRVRILLTNDDGFDAPGLAAGWRALSALAGVQIDVIAPITGHSGGGHVFSDNLRISRRRVEPMSEILVVEGTPVDCVCAGVHLPGRPRPDWVVAGINRGSNLGVDVYTSGTAAAARQAAIFGIPAVAVSQLVRKPLPDNWDESTRQAAAVLAALIQPTAPPPPAVSPSIHAETLRAILGATTGQGPAPCWNVNLPRPPDGLAPPLGVRLAPLSRDPIHLQYEYCPNPDGTETLRYVGSYAERPSAPGSDVEAAFSGFITVTLVPL